jgi:hypothetical protein
MDPTRYLVLLLRLRAAVEQMQIPIQTAVKVAGPAVAEQMVVQVVQEQQAKEMLGATEL